MGMAMMGTANARGEGRARSAAEAAISSPLLEDVDLSGAGGVLVNITAGPDMSIGEFEEVGDVVRSFTSEDATVVVGTVIDPNMTDELRVTVVVTGLGDKSKVEQKSRSYYGGVGVVNSPKISKTDENVSTNGVIDYRRYDKPAVLRNNVASVALSGSSEDVTTKMEQNIEYLDIPSFLRREDKAKD